MLLLTTSYITKVIHLMAPGLSILAEKECGFYIKRKDFWLKLRNFDIVF